MENATTPISKPLSKEKDYHGGNNCRFQAKSLQAN